MKRKGSDDSLSSVITGMTGMTGLTGLTGLMTIATTNTAKTKTQPKKPIVENLDLISEDSEEAYMQRETMGIDVVRMGKEIEFEDKARELEEFHVNIKRLRD